MDMLKSGKCEMNNGGSGPDYPMAGGKYATTDGGAFQIRIFSAGSETQAGFMTQKNSPIKKPQDIKKGTRLILMVTDPAFMRYYNSLLAWAQLSPDDVTFVRVNTLDAKYEYLQYGKGDIAFGAPSFPQAYKVEASPGGLAWISLDAGADPAGAKRFMDANPYFTPGIKMTQGVPSAQGQLGMVAIGCNYTAQRVSPDLMYNVAKWLDTKYDSFKGTHPWAAAITQDNLMILARWHWAPVHEGVVKYLKEKNVWTDKYQQRWQANVDNLTAWGKAYQDAMALAKSRGVPIDPENQAWMDLWNNYAKEQKLVPINYWSSF